MENTTQPPFFSPGSEDEKKILKLYLEYRKKFISYMLYHHTIDEDILKDIYQESFLVLVDKIRSGEIKDNLKAYLFSASTRSV